MPLRPLPLIAPNPPRLAALGDAFSRIDASGIFTNNGPELQAFEAEATAQLFGGRGACLGVANATLGLLLAIREAAPHAAPGALALMPALTFAATAQAAWWAGFTPLVADIDPADWTMAAAAEEALLRHYAGRVAVIVPYATFGRPLDLERYARLGREHGVGVVIDAAASLGTADDAGLNFGAGAPFAVVYSMHATKTFATAEGGLIHCGDADRIARLRAMAGFGFEHGRSATLPGLNAKLPEVLATIARAKLAAFDETCARREAVAVAYRSALGDRYPLQPAVAGRQALQFMPVLLPPGSDRARIAATLAADGIGTGSYFSPHLGQQPWLRAVSLLAPTPVADDVAGRLLSLPVTDAMLPADAGRVVAALDRACARRPHARPAAPAVSDVLLVGGGPAGTAFLTAASKCGALPRLAAGLTVVERDDALGNGRLGRYAITSDSTADTFLSAVRDNPHPELAALADHPAGRAVAGYRDALGVPLPVAGGLLRETGQRLAQLAARDGATLLTGHEAIGARRSGDRWQVTLRRLADGTETTRHARALVLATGGHQPLDRLAAQDVGGAALVTQAGDRLLQSDAVLGDGGMALVADLLAGKRAPRIAIVGGSTSALAAAVLLLKSALPLGAGAITLLHRRPLRPFYPSPEAALAEGFDDFGDDDRCPVSGFVYRLGGFRLEARELVLRMLAVGGRVPEPRLALHRIAPDDPAARAILADADLVIAALGYRPHALPLFGAGGRRLALAADAGGALVDRHCRIVAADGRPLPDAYAIGLAAGFVPWGAMGGEPSFRGQANGLWQWQNDVGRMIVEQLLGTRANRAAA